MRDYKNEDKCGYYHDYTPNANHKRKCEDPCNDHPRFKPMVLTTGVLNTVVDQTAALIEVANFDQVRTFEVRVQVINWNGATPVVQHDQIVTLLPNQHFGVTQPVTPFLYEIRIFHPGSPNVIANTFAINAGGSTLPGLTFNQKDLMKLDVACI